MTRDQDLRSQLLNHLEISRYLKIKVFTADATVVTNSQLGAKKFFKRFRSQIFRTSKKLSAPIVDPTSVAAA